MRLKPQEEADLLFYKASRLEEENKKLRAVVAEWLPIVQRQLDGLLRAAEAQDGAKSLFESAAWKAANERVDRMRTALEFRSVCQANEKDSQ